MKIKSKLLAGGLMTAVACGLVGSITGTFAWYQYALNSTVSMHGVSVGKTKNLEFSLDASSWSTDDLSWSDIKDTLTYGTLNATTNIVELAPVSNGALESGDDLNDEWYGNPDGQNYAMPEIDLDEEEPFLQFSFYARIVETEDGDTFTPIDGTIFVTDIAAGLATNVANALMMHVDFGDQQFLVNPAVASPSDITLRAIYDKSTIYDWTSTTNQIVYQLPVPNELPIDATDLDNAPDAGELKPAAHNTIVATPNASGVLSSNFSVPFDADDNYVTITVTLWLEGFGLLAGEDSQHTPSQWWDITLNADDELWAGFELTGVPTVA